MSIQSLKLELIKQIESTQNEGLLKKLQRVFKQNAGIKNSTVDSSLSVDESQLLLKINEGLPEDMQIRYNELSKKSVSHTITEEERKELLKYIPVFEAKHAERLQYLAKLAALRNISVDELMTQLDIQPPEIIYG